MKFYITTPIYYINAAPTIGSAYTTIAADVLARWNRLNGNKVFYLTGLDENSSKTLKAAERAGYKDIKKYMNYMAKKWKESWKKLNINYDGFIRTTENRHKKFVQDFFMKIYKNGDVYRNKYSGYYCDDCEAYLTESDLIEGKCPYHKIKPEFIEEDNFFFKLSKYQDKIIGILKNEDFLKPESRRNEIINFVESGLKDISISRQKAKCGIEVPIDKSMKMWCWFDALLNYISGSEGNFPQELCLIGKDITRFHSVFFTGFLLSAKYKLPKTIFAHGFLTINGQKMSKSLGNVIDPLELVKKYHPDVIRYYLMRSIPFGDDGDFSEEALIKRNNTELADSLGNLLNRVVSMCDRYCDSKIPKAKEDKTLSSKLNFKKIDSYIENYELHNALNDIFHFVDECNKYINEKEPWNLAKNKKIDELQSVLFNTAEALRMISQLIYPFMPEASLKIEEQLGFKHRDIFDMKWGNAKSKGIKKGDNLFKKYETANKRK